MVASPLRALTYGFALTAFLLTVAIDRAAAYGVDTSFPDCIDVFHPEQTLGGYTNLKLRDSGMDGTIPYQTWSSDADNNQLPMMQLFFGSEKDHRPNRLTVISDVKPELYAGGYKISILYGDKLVPTNFALPPKHPWSNVKGYRCNFVFADGITDIKIARAHVTG